MSGKSLRMARLARNGRILMVPMDHGVSMGPAPGLANPGTTLAAAAAGGATCTTLHKGLVKLATPYAAHLGILMHLSASTDASADPHDKRLVATVEDAVRAGCDGVSIHVNVGAATEARQLQEMGQVSSACAQWGMPLIAMMYPRGPKVTDPSNPALVAHAARLGAELGADAVKVPYTGSVESFRQVVQGAGVAVLVAGGAQGSLDDLLLALRDARTAGAAGVSIGRHMFQNPEPERAMAAIARVFS